MSNFHTETIERIKAVIYGQCIGDAIGLLTEFMTQEKAFEVLPASLYLLKVEYKPSHVNYVALKCTCLH